ncbi:unnamed protein product, partial [Clonostachys byssicola]
MEDEPILIIGAGICGLVLAQYLRKEKICFRIFERDNDLATRGVGWGLTLNWSLPALRSLLPEDLVLRLPETYVDRASVQAGAISTFPFFDLSTGERKFQTPKAPESQRIWVTRQKLRVLLATGIDIEWGKSFSKFDQGRGSVTAAFEDGSTATGRLLIACDGANSRARRQLFPNQNEMHRIPICLMGMKLELSHEKAQLIRNLDPFFLQGTSSENNSFIYISLLDAPQSKGDLTENTSTRYASHGPTTMGSWTVNTPSNAERIQLFQRISSTWGEPFLTIAKEVAADQELKSLELRDFPPPRGLRTNGRAVLMGDSFHAMAMYRGEGANHAIVDVLDFVESVGPKFRNEDVGCDSLIESLNAYERSVVERARTGVLASRQACLDAHNWSRITSESPLLTRREMKLQFDESNLSDVLYQGGKQCLVPPMSPYGVFSRTDIGG